MVTVYTKRRLAHHEDINQLRPTTIYELPQEVLRMPTNDIAIAPEKPVGTRQMWAIPDVPRIIS